MTKLIALTGYVASGKNLAASGLIGWTQIAFASPIRQQLETLNPIVAPPCLRLKEAINLYGWDFAKHEFKEIRSLMQRFGTEVGREWFGKNVWVDFAERSIFLARNDVVITDLRFPNEAEMVRRRRGLIVRIFRPGIEAVNEHSSEHQVIAADQIIVNDGTSVDLHRKINEVASLIPDRCPEFVG